jgi:arylformamidase
MRLQEKYASTQIRKRSFERSATCSSSGERLSRFLDLRGAVTKGKVWMRLASCICVPILVATAVATTGAQPAPTHARIPYGPDGRNLLDFWQASGEGPRPLIVFIHGGGWFSGDRSIEFAAYQRYLNAGISYASIDYRLTPEHPLPAPVYDAARAVQFLRSMSADWNIDSKLIAAIGASAGGCTALWLLLHDDLANPYDPDPVLRESTRLAAVLAFDAQTSIEPAVVESWIGPKALEHPMISRATGLKEPGAVRSQQYDSTYREFSPITHVDAADPPLMLFYSKDPSLPPVDAEHAIHHPEFGRQMKLRSQSVGHECVLQLGASDVSTLSGFRFLTDALSPQRTGRTPTHARPGAR